MARAGSTEARRKLKKACSSLSGAASKRVGPFSMGRGQIVELWDAIYGEFTPDGGFR